MARGGVASKAALLASERWLRRSNIGLSRRVLFSFSSFSIVGDHLRSTNSTKAFSSAVASPSFRTPRRLLSAPVASSPLFFLELFSTARPPGGGGLDEMEGEEWSDEWEEDEDIEPKIGDGGDGGGIVLGDVAWGERALSLAREVLLQFDDDMVLYAFKVSPKGYVYVRLDKLTNKYGCPSMEEIENFSNIYKKRLDEIGECGELPADLALEVSSPGAERLLKVPEDLDRFKEMPMWVYYSEENNDSKHHQQSEKVLILESVDSETKQCVWKLANVRENREDLGKGRPLSRKQKDWRLTLSFQSINKVTLYLDPKMK